MYDMKFHYHIVYNINDWHGKTICQDNEIKRQLNLDTFILYEHSFYISAYE